MGDRPEHARESTEAEAHLSRATDVAEQADASADAIDFSLVHADDAFLDALGGAHPDGSFADDRLAQLLLAWRNDVDAEPITEDLVDPKLAVATVRAAKIRQRRGTRLIAPLAGAAAVLAIVFAGVGLAAREAEPGDTLWGLTRVLYADHARSVEAAQAVRTDLREAEEALAHGRVADAKDMLDQARSTLPTVSNEDGQADLQAQHDALVAKLPDNPVVDASPPPSASPTTAPVTNPTSPTTDPADTTSTNQPPPSQDTSTTTTTTTTSTEPKSEPGRVETQTTSPNGNAPNGTGPNGTGPNGGAPQGGTPNGGGEQAPAGGGEPGSPTP